VEEALPSPTLDEIRRRPWFWLWETNLRAEEASLLDSCDKFQRDPFRWEPPPPPHTFTPETVRHFIKKQARWAVVLRERSA
jgi:hypothetical protein